MITEIDKDMLPHVAEANIISLDGDISVHSGEPIVIIRPKKTIKEQKDDITIHYISKDIDNVIHQSITGYGISGKTTRVKLKIDQNNTWISPDEYNKFSIIRKTTVYCQPEELELAGEPINGEITKDNVGAINIDIEGVFNNPPQNRRVIFSGELDGTEGGLFSETGKIASASKVPEMTLQLGGKETKIDYTNISVELDNKEIESFRLKRDTVKIYGNVVAASQGETRREVLGSGDGRKESQTFVLKQANKDAHLTYVSAVTATGSASTLKVFVNDIRWHETDILSNCTSIDQNFITKTDEEGGVSVIFGNGKKGARLPTGIENVRAEYRTGIGDAGNVKLGQISLLVDRPLGVKEVINPVAASSGSDKDKLNQARKNALRAIRTLDRLISVQDYEDFAATYAGIGKAKAVELSNGQRQVVHVTIAGTSSHPDKQLANSSGLIKKLRESLYKYGDPQQEVQLAICELMHIVLKANVCILPDYNWEKVEAELRSKLLDAFNYEGRELGQDVLLGEMYSIMQAVPGVDYVDIDAFGGIPERIKGDKNEGIRRILTQEERDYAIDCLKMSINKEGVYRLLSSEEIADAIWCWCPYYFLPSDDGTETSYLGAECRKYPTCKNHKKYFQYIEAKTPRHRLEANLAAFESDDIRPAQLAFLSPDLPETLVLKQIK